jgi:hypothetical protein
MAEVGRDERHVYLGPMPRPSSAINSQLYPRRGQPGPGGMTTATRQL